MLDATQKFSVIKYSADGLDQRESEVVVEAPFQVMVNDDLVATVMLSPINLKEFLVGFLYGQGIIKSLDDVQNMLIDEKRGLLWAQAKTATDIKLTKTLITSGCTGGIALDNFDDLKPLQKQELTDYSVLNKFMNEMLASSEIYKKSGGMHSACLASTEKMLFNTEDIGRHNCLDKVIGFLVLNEINLSNKIILTSGRLSLEAIVKTARAGVNSLGSRSTPTSLAIEMAKKLNINLFGYIRSEKLTVYS